MDYATLGPSELGPLFTIGYIQRLHASFYLIALNRRQTLYIMYSFRKVLRF